MNKNTKIIIGILIIVLIIGIPYILIEKSVTDRENFKYKVENISNTPVNTVSNEQYAMLYFYNNQFGVCGTGRTTENITLNNGKEATIGYYDENEKWSDISFNNTNKNIAVLNHGLINDESNEAIEFIKTINITEN